MRRSAAIVHRQMGQGLSSLATVASIAPMVGILGTLVGIVNSFRGITGSRISHMAMVSSLLSDACVPTALGLLIAVPSLWFYKYLAARLECFDREMENASLELVNLPIVCPVVLAPTPTLKFVTESPIFRERLETSLQKSVDPGIGPT